MPNSHARAEPRDGPEAAAAAVGALERERGDVLGREAVAQQRRHVRVHVVAARAVEPLELDVRGGRLRLHGECVAHTRTTTEGTISSHRIIGSRRRLRIDCGGGRPWEGLGW